MFLYLWINIFYHFEHFHNAFFLYSLVRQLCSIPVVVIIILVLLFIAPLFFHLPKVSVLSLCALIKVGGG